MVSVEIFFREEYNEADSYQHYQHHSQNYPLHVGEGKTALGFLCVFLRGYLDCKQYGPSQNLCGQRCSQGVYQVWGRSDQANHFCTVVSEKISQDVSDDDDGSRELDPLVLSVADEQGHRYGQDRQENFVFSACPPKENCGQGMQESEDMYYPGNAQWPMFCHVAYF